MNNSFSLSRFSNLFRKHTAEHYKSYLMSLVVITGILFIWVSFHMIMHKRPMDIDTQFITFMFMFLLSGTIFTSAVFSELGEQKKAIALLTLPASPLEKFFVKWLYSYIIFQFVFVGIFYIVMEPMQNLFHEDAEHKKELLNIFHYPMKNVFIAYAVLHAIAIWGAIFFKKFHFIKTTFAALIVLMVFLIANRQIMEAMLKRNILSAVPFISADFVTKDRYHYISITLPEGTGDYLPYMLVILITFIFWTAAYFRLKEKQV